MVGILMENDTNWGSQAPEDTFFTALTVTGNTLVPAVVIDGRPGKKIYLAYVMLSYDGDVPSLLTSNVAAQLDFENTGGGGGSHGIAWRLITADTVLPGQPGDILDPPAHSETPGDGLVLTVTGIPVNNTVNTNIVVAGWFDA